MRNMGKLFGPIVLGLLSSASLFAQFAPTGNTTLQVNVGVEAGIRVDTAITNLLSPSTFADYVGSTNFTYKIRTSSGGSGTITMQITSDFAPAGGPSVAAPPDPTDTLAYTCSLIAPGTACAGSQSASTTAQTGVATFGGDAHSTKLGNGPNSVAWTLSNDPLYDTGAYNATATFTISAT